MGGRRDDIALEVLPLPAWLADAEGTVLQANEPWRSLTGHAAGSHLGESLTDDDGQRLMQAMSQVGMREPVHVEIRVARDAEEGPAFDCLLRRLPPSADAAFLGVCYDVTDVRREARRLTYMATHDALTGLTNRWLFEDTLRRAVSRARRGECGVVMMMDLDNFKRYNDTFGHLRGDQALINVALLMQSYLRAADLLARFGGDEFAVLLEGTTLDEAREVAERMRDAASGEFVEGAGKIGLGLSIGLTRFDGTRDHEAVLQEADSALYAAKQLGRGRVAGG